MPDAWRSSPRSEPDPGQAPGEPAATAAPSTVTAVLILTEARAAAWAWSRLVRGPGMLRGTPGLGFAKVLGSGHEGGFGLRPSMTRGGLFCVFETEAQAQAFVDTSALVQRYRNQTRELCSVILRPYSSRGTWGGMALPCSAAAPAGGPVAALTRASIRPLRAMAFWRRAPAAQAAMAGATGCQLGVGLGEAPLLRQATFSIWDSVQAMENYARQGAHLAAARAAQAGGHFTEAMFVRFTVRQLRGVWKGRSYG
jgi:hypothetical protein